MIQQWQSCAKVNTFLQSLPCSASLIVWQTMMQGWYYVCGPLHHHVLLSSIFWGRRVFSDPICCSFLHGLAMIFLRDSLCLSAVFLYRGYDMIFWIFPIVPCHAFCMWRWQIGKDLDLSFVWGHRRHSEYTDISRPAEYSIACHTVLMRPNKVETAVHDGCNCWLSVWTLLCRCPVKLLT